jgi:hypothetical protein
MDTFLFVCIITLSYPFIVNRLGGVVVSMLRSSVVDRGFESRSGHAKDF